MIGETAFYKNEITSVVIPDSVTTIGEDAFSYNRLTSVVVPDVADVHPHAFAQGVEIIRRSMVVERFKIEDLQSHSVD